jgi:hypothetical protein
MATRQHPERPATLRTYRETITVHPARLTDRLAASRRKDAFIALFVRYERKPDAIYELTRAEPRCQLPDEKQRALIHAGITDGMISRQQIIQYRAAQLIDDLAQFPDAHIVADAQYVPLMTEIAECAEALTVARGIPTPANIETAKREAAEAAAAIHLYSAAREWAS